MPSAATGAPRCAAPPLARSWLPFGSPRPDLSGFRPTLIAAGTETAIEAQARGEARFRLATCGGAALFVNDAEAGWLARDRRRGRIAEKGLEAVVVDAHLPPA